MKANLLVIKLHKSVESKNENAYDRKFGESEGRDNPFPVLSLRTLKSHNAYCAKPKG